MIEQITSAAQQSPVPIEKNPQEDGIISIVKSLASGVWKLIEKGAGISDKSVFTGTSLQFGAALPSILFFSTVGLPLAATLLGCSILRKSYQIYRQSMLLRALAPEITEQNREEFHLFLSEKLKDKKIKALGKETDPRIATIMENLRSHLEKNPDDLETANKALADIKTLLNRKIKVGAISALANIAMLATIIAGSIFPPALAAVPVVPIGKALVDQEIHTYMKNKFESHLKHPEFLKKID